ncbi:FtsX-like permease family protein [Acetivibrio saccincola]|uniref:FtsX-like permease family protein n=1 Tax=Acetivibrio saccincola TaxID=1677857 RepID=A0A2K9EP13_9FIRM|nr:ABC transporter permease [Acetivibrio saccincola]AUG58361.1 FtsX-like permease family protein [Acetivibrio saccincola]
MKTELFLLKKYWMSHKKQALSILISIIIMSSAVMFISLLTRSEDRYSFHESLDMCGNFDEGLYNLTEEEIELLKEQEEIDLIGKTIVFGRIGSPDYSDRTVAVGYFDDDIEKELMHLPISKGRFPEKEDEIAVEMSTLISMNIQPLVGGEIKFVLYGMDKKLIGEKAYTLVGIIDDLSYNSFRENNDISNLDPWNYVSEYPDPLAIVSKEEGEKYPALYTNVHLTYVNGDKMGFPSLKEFDEDVAKIIKEKSSNAFGGRKMAISSFVYYPSGGNISEKLMAGEKQELANKYRLIRIYAFICLIISAISIYMIISIYLLRRLESFRLLRLCGMTRKRTLRIMVMEMFIFGIIGTAAGMVIASLAHEITLFIRHIIYNVPIYRGYFIEYVLETRSFNPFIFTVIVTGLTVLIGFIYPFIKVLKTPIGSSEIVKKIRVKKYGNALRKTITARRSTALMMLFIFITILSSTLGMMVRAGNVASIERQSFTAQVMTAGFDGYISRNKWNDTSKFANINYDKGFPSDIISELEEKEYVSSVSAVLTDHTVRVYLGEGTREDELRKKLSSIELKNQVEKVCQIDKTIDFDREWQNYLQYFEDFGLDDTYAYYSIPVAACNDYLLSQLEEYVTDGEINIEALNSGEQVLVIEHIDNLRKVKNAFEVGDKVNILTSVAVDEKQISELIYDRLAYLPQKPFFAHPVVGGIITVTDPEISSLLEYIGDNPDKTPGFNFVTSFEGYQAWGFPQKNYDKVGINLTSEEYAEELDEFIYSKLSSEMGVTYVSMSEELKGIQRQMKNKAFVYLVMLVLMLAIFVIGFANSFTMYLNSSMRHFSSLRAFGISRRNLKKHIIVESLKLPVICALISGIICFLIKKAYKLLFDYQQALLTVKAPGASPDEVMVLTEKYTNIQNKFFMDFKLWEQDFISPLVAISLGIALLSAIIILVILRKSDDSIIEKIRSSFKEE